MVDVTPGAEKRGSSCEIAFQLSDASQCAPQTSQTVCRVATPQRQRFVGGITLSPAMAASLVPGLMTPGTYDVENAEEEAVCFENFERERAQLMAAIEGLSAAADAATRRAELVEKTSFADVRSAFETILKEYVATEVRQAIRSVTAEAIAEATAELRAAAEELRHFRSVGMGCASGQDADRKSEYLVTEVKHAIRTATTEATAEATAEFRAAAAEFRYFRSSARRSIAGRPAPDAPCDSDHGHSSPYFEPSASQLRAGADTSCAASPRYKTFATPAASAAPAAPSNPNVVDTVLARVGSGDSLQRYPSRFASEECVTTFKGQVADVVELVREVPVAAGTASHAADATADTDIDDAHITAAASSRNVAYAGGVDHQVGRHSRSDSVPSTVRDVVSHFEKRREGTAQALRLHSATAGVPVVMSRGVRAGTCGVPSTFALDKFSRAANGSARSPGASVATHSRCSVARTPPTVN